MQAWSTEINQVAIETKYCLCVRVCVCLAGREKAGRFRQGCGHVKEAEVKTHIISTKCS